MKEREQYHVVGQELFVGMSVCPKGGIENFVPSLRIIVIEIGGLAPLSPKISAVLPSDISSGEKEYTSGQARYSK